jgi:mannose-1-phosphate guanylyltransferase
MNVILLAAGLGTRLRPITDILPKCLVSIKGRPLLEIWLEKLVNSGIESILINTHYLSDQVENFISKSVYQKKVKLVHEIELNGTAGTLIKNIDFYNDSDGMLIHADNYCLADLKEFKMAHYNRSSSALITMMTFQTDRPNECGIVQINENGIVKSFHEKKLNPPGNIANGAIYILSPEFIYKMKNDFSYAKDFSTEVLGALIGNIQTYHVKNLLIDIGTIDNLNKANQLTQF